MVSFDYDNILVSGILFVDPLTKRKKKRREKREKRMWVKGKVRNRRKGKRGKEEIRKKKEENRKENEEKTKKKGRKNEEKSPVVGWNKLITFRSHKQSWNKTPKTGEVKANKYRVMG